MLEGRRTYLSLREVGQKREKTERFKTGDPRTEWCQPPSILL